jgi:hypothetical protein
VYCNAIPNRSVYVSVGLDEIVLTHFMRSIIVVVVVVVVVMVVVSAAAVH